MDTLLLGTEAFSLLQKEGFPVLETMLARDEDEAARIASSLGYPVALKISSPDVVHKTEAGGIRASLKDEAEVKKAFEEITRAFASNSPDKKLDGALIQKQGKGLELIVGVITDRQFGPVIMFGVGGVFVEALNDVAFRLIPLSPADAKEMMEDIQSYKVIANPRGEKIDINAVRNFLVQVSRLIEKHPEIKEMDLNPIFASADGVTVCDVRIKIG
jgi:acetyl-CoA synthetase (ADP-forming)